MKKTALQASWRALPKAMKISPEVVRAYADQSMLIGSPELNEEVVRLSLKREWTPVLLIPYARTGGV